MCKFCKEFLYVCFYKERFSFCVYNFYYNFMFLHNGKKNFPLKLKFTKAELRERKHYHLLLHLLIQVKRKNNTFNYAAKKKKKIHYDIFYKLLLKKQQTKDKTAKNFILHKRC